MLADLKGRAGSILHSDSFQARALTTMNTVAPSSKATHPRILCYHGIESGSPIDRFAVTPSQFESHLRVAARVGATAQRCQTLDVTFDDNLRSHVDVAMPILRNAGMTATFFLNVDLIGTELTMFDVEALVEAGMSVGVHNAVHTVASQMPMTEFRRCVEICADFCDSIDQDRRWAYPGGFLGSFTAEQDAYLSDRGFWRYTTVEGDADGNRLAVQPRYVIRRYMTADHIEGIAAGRFRALGTMKRARHRLVTSLAANDDC